AARPALSLASYEAALKAIVPAAKALPEPLSGTVAVPASVTTTRDPDAAGPGAGWNVTVTGQIPAGRSEAPLQGPGSTANAGPPSTRTSWSAIGDAPRLWMRTSARRVRPSATVPKSTGAGSTWRAPSENVRKVQEYSWGRPFPARSRTAVETVALYCAPAWRGAEGANTSRFSAGSKEAVPPAAPPGPSSLKVP